MNALPISLEARPFQGLLNGLVKKNFMGANDITNDYLLEELYADMEESVEGQFASEILLYEKILLKAAEQNWDQDRLLEFLTTRDLPSGHIQVFSNIWAKDSKKINKQLLDDVTWNNKFNHLAWRIDIRALSKSTTEQSDEPVSFFEMSMKKNEKIKIAKFEMNREEVQNILGELNDIQAVFDSVR